MSDSDPARQVDVPLAGVRELRLSADDAGDGIACDMANWAEARLDRDPRAPRFGPAALMLDGAPAPPPSDSACGLALVARETGPQVAIMQGAGTLTASVNRGEEVRCTIPIANLTESVQIAVGVGATGAAPAEVEVVVGAARITRTLDDGGSATLISEPLPPAAAVEIALITRGVDAPAGARWSGLRQLRGEHAAPLPLVVPAAPATLPPPPMPSYRPAIEQELIEWDWRMQDGIGTDREPRSWSEAIALTLERGDRLIAHLAASGAPPAAHAADWQAARRRYQELAATTGVTDAASGIQWAQLWRDLHRLRRQIALGNPLARTGPILFAKRVPSSFSHRLTQYSGRCARPGGGLRQLTGGAYDDFAPRYLPDGKILFLSTRRGGFHRCGQGPCPVHTLALAEDALFPESELPVGGCHAPAGVPAPPAVPPEERRWPGHCYRTPYPLSEDLFLAAYSFDPLIGEPHANSPRVGLANASPGKQVLATVPVEPDGSAYFRAPAGIPLAFQALDDRGMAVQTMCSLTYLQPGEQTGCIGCHEDRATAPSPRGATANRKGHEMTDYEHRLARDPAGARTSAMSRN